MRVGLILLTVVICGLVVASRETIAVPLNSLGSSVFGISGLQLLCGLTLLALGGAIGPLVQWLLFAPKFDPDKADLRSQKQNAYRQRFYPPAYPNGWYKIMNGEEVKSGQSKYVQYLGQHFVVFRTQTGKVGVLDAFCPHLGANLAIGGEVVGECLRCPFHQWSFATDGKCTHVPYFDGKTPESANAKSWHTVEFYGMIFIWFDAEEREPQWQLPRVPEIDDGKMVYRGNCFGADVGMHIQEWSENGVDFAHFPFLHGRMMIPWTTKFIPFIDIKHEGRYEIDADQPHISYFYDKAVLVIRGREIERTRANAKISFVGSTGLVNLRFTIPELGDIVLFECHTPREPMVLRTDFRWFADKRIPRILVWYVVGSWYAQWHNDRDIWENKIYRRPPVILKGDGPVNKFRGWYKQFYSEHSQEFSKGLAQYEW